MIAEPPVELGAVHDTAAEIFPAIAETPVGAPGLVAGVTALEAPEAAPSPTPLVATTVNVYGVPFVKPLTLQDLAAPFVSHDLPPGDEVTL